MPNKKITIEIKSLNSKNLDLNTRIPSKYREKEIQIRRQLAKELVRGKIDISLFAEITAEELTTQINKEIVQQYHFVIRQDHLAIMQKDLLSHLVESVKERFFRGHHKFDTHYNAENVHIHYILCKSHYSCVPDVFEDKYIQAEN